MESDWDGSLTRSDTAHWPTKLVVPTERKGSTSWTAVGTIADKVGANSALYASVATSQHGSDYRGWSAFAMFLEQGEQGRFLR